MCIVPLLKAAAKSAARVLASSMACWIGAWLRTSKDGSSFSTAWRGRTELDRLVRLDSRRGCRPASLLPSPVCDTRSARSVSTVLVMRTSARRLASKSPGPSCEKFEVAAAEPERLVPPSEVGGGVRETEGVRSRACMRNREVRGVGLAASIEGSGSSCDSVKVQECEMASMPSVALVRR